MGTLCSLKHCAQAWILSPMLPYTVSPSPDLVHVAAAEGTSAASDGTQRIQINSIDSFIKLVLGSCCAWAETAYTAS